ncbi:hypothetical protein [Nocardioides faecalis]|uniref:hypothetical protein n=1 Tax=Nocardioides faecalis TaxID=2803858 RepID=UPI001965CE8E|nr:hypothetical protein [Nocardioides faecalis]QVI60151.1 hypothetical protein KG111_07590 [Nocardioides faecalis]
MGKGMGRDYGPWVRHEWCPSCVKVTEQTRWHRRVFGEPPERGEHRIRCNECSQDVAAAGRSGRSPVSHSA